MNNFWQKLITIFENSEIVIDRPKGSVHPKYSSIIYPLDYGYLKGSKSGDGTEIDVWCGSLPERKIDYIIATADILKNDVEIKLLCGCTKEEKDLILGFHNSSEFMSAITIEK